MMLPESAEESEGSDVPANADGEISFTNYNRLMRSSVCFQLHCVRH